MAENISQSPPAAVVDVGWVNVQAGRLVRVRARPRPAAARVEFAEHG